MSVQTIVIFDHGDDNDLLEIDGKQILETLSNRDKRIAVQLQEILESIRDTVRNALDVEGELQIEISGSLDMKASGGINYLIYNLSGEANKSNSMTVTLKTKITPTQSQ